MLSRVANSLYWMSRYLERAENTARLLDVNLHLILDLPCTDAATLSQYWRPIVRSLGDEALFDSLHTRATRESVSRFLIFQPENTNSVISCIDQARENARMVRDQITVDFWEELNRLYLYLHSSQATRLLQASPAEFFQEIKSVSLLLQGMSSSMVVRNEGWHFLLVGRYIERADKTSRMLDIHESAPEPVPAALLFSADEARNWSAILRCCSAWEAYQFEYGTEIDPASVTELLFFSGDFPRSIRFCIEQLNFSLRHISGVSEGRFANDAERLTGRLLAELRFGTVSEIMEAGLHQSIDLLQTRLNAIGAALFNAYILHAFVEGESDRLRQQEEQQQQRLARA